MKRIRNIVFDLGGVLIDLDHHQAVSRFEEIGVKDAKQLLDPYEQKGFFLELENGKIDVDTFCRKLCEHTGKQLSYDEIKYAWMGFIADVPQYKLNFLLGLFVEQYESDCPVVGEERGVHPRRSSYIRLFRQNVYFL